MMLGAKDKSADWTVRMCKLTRFFVVHIGFKHVFSIMNEAYLREEIHTGVKSKK